ncbi:MAG TPA: DNA-3-methyladenine glycosylase [Chthonomonadaceae bacterium]|nr:DNA-3-methyladenine glycosylase [Chthonomonadaceae bacterium]
MESTRGALSREYYLRDTIDVARDLLGCVLARWTPDGLVTGRISETEAYEQREPSCHSHRGKTARNAVMFGAPGHAYVYFTYGMHFCFNAVSGEEGVANAVLIRAVEPIVGWELMCRRRGLGEEEQALGSRQSTFGDGIADSERAAGTQAVGGRRSEDPEIQPAGGEARTRVRFARILCGGPGRLCQAFAIGREDNGVDLTTGLGLWIEPGAEGVGHRAAPDATRRIGIRQATDLPWRFTLPGDPYTSR